MRSTIPRRIVIDLETTRLNVQHGFLKRHIRERALPQDLKLPPGARILDSGTGTGAAVAPLKNDLLNPLANLLQVPGYLMQSPRHLQDQ